MDSTRVKIVVFTPLEATDAVREALGKAGAGQLGEYSFCSYAVVGKGYFLPSENAEPHIGKPGEFETVTEERIEVTCDRDKAHAVVDAMKAAHPYEEVAFDIYPLVELTGKTDI